VKEKKRNNQRVEKGAKIAPGKHKNFAIRETDRNATRPKPPKSATSKKD